MISMVKAVLAVVLTSVGLQIVAEKLDFSVAHAESDSDIDSVFGPDRPGSNGHDF